MNYEEIAAAIIPKRLNVKALKGMEELRLRLGRQVACTVNNKEILLSDCAVNENDIRSVINIATNASFYSSSTAISEGYISYKGLRIGVCGNAVIKDGSSSGFSSITSLCIRIPHDCPGVLSKECDMLYKNGAKSTLIISPPGGGKTTALREVIRELSSRGFRVSVADERSELSSGFALGDKTDVITNMSKLPSALSMLRSMNPEIIAFDEITKSDDLNAVREIIGCGVKIAATAHGERIEAMKARKIYRDLFDEQLFEAVIAVKHIGPAREYSCCIL